MKKEILFFDETTGRYFRATEEEVKCVESKMNDILKRRLPFGTTIITLGETMDCLGMVNDEELEETDNEPNEKEDKQIDEEVDFSELVKMSSSSNASDVLFYSAKLAEICGVDNSLILHTKEEIDKLFTK